MYKVDFSLSKWNFTVYFNNEEDYITYKEMIKNSVYEMYHKKSNYETIVINYINDKNIYNEVLNSKRNKKEKISTFENEYYDKYDDLYVSSKNRYLVLKDENIFNLICKENLKRPELIYIIREIYVRLQENDKSLFMHGNGIKYCDLGLIIMGNSGSGKTTFMFKLFEDNKDDFSYLSNDRIFIKDNGTMDYFPIPLILAVGTARNTKEISNYLKGKESLYDSVFSKELFENGKDYEKFELFKKYIPKIFPNCTLQEHELLNKIIIPKINFECEKPKIAELEDYQKAMDMCFTPTDSESLRRPWIMPRDNSDEELLSNSKQALSNLVNQGKVYTVEYNPKMKSEYLQEEIKKKVLKK